MTASRVAAEFMDRCASAEDVEAVQAILFSEMARLGYAFVACCSHVDPLRPPAGAISMINYPETWLKRFSEENFALHDPVFMAARQSVLPFFWDDIMRRPTLSRAQLAILREAEDAGLRGGMTIPIHSPGALPASCSLVPGPDGVDPLQIPDVFLMAIYAHETARQKTAPEERTMPSQLTPRERECLALAGIGKSDWAIGQILRIHHRTVHNTIERAKRRYGVAFRVQAVVRAVLDGQIAVDELSD